MSDSIRESDPTTDVHANSQADSKESTRFSEPTERAGRRPWWLGLVIPPLLLVIGGSLLFGGIGVAQRFGFLADSAGPREHASGTNAGGTRYICPMMCTPPQDQPGRCPVCAMELVSAASTSANANNQSVDISPAARRVADIQVESVKALSVDRTIRAVGEVAYDEGSLKTISAYVPGRLERLYADFTGVVVQKGDHLALLYSPRLFSSQAELILAKEARQQGQSMPSSRITRSGSDLYESTRQRLIEFGMTEEQLQQLETAGKASSRLHLCAPIGGTVIEKLAVEGEYVKEGDPIYRLADLSTVWLILQLFPEDAASVRIGLKVEAQFQSLPGQKFVGRVSFVDPKVDAESRTVGVRVAVPNPAGVLRVGDFAKATIRVPVTGLGHSLVFDEELAGKWISPRHPHILSDKPGACPVCGVAMVPTRDFGFADEATNSSKSLVVPRDSVLILGEESIVYVETEPGRFEIRRVTLGPICDDKIVIVDGLKEGESIATRSNFLIDSQMQLVGNPSLIDPSRIGPTPSDSRPRESLTPMEAAFASLAPAESKLARAQKICPVTEMELGSMGPPLPVKVRDKTVYICCEGCRSFLLAEPDKYLARLEPKTNAPPTPPDAKNFGPTPPFMKKSQSTRGTEQQP